MTWSICHSNICAYSLILTIIILPRFTTTAFNWLPLLPDLQGQSTFQNTKWQHKMSICYTFNTHCCVLENTHTRPIKIFITWFLLQPQWTISSSGGWANTHFLQRGEKAREKAELARKPSRETAVLRLCFKCLR